MILTDRQLEVAKLVARGLSNKQIAQSLDLSFHTVRAHISMCLAKTGSANRAALAYWLNSHPRPKGAK